MDGIRATPMQYPILGLLADRLKRAQQFAVAPGGYANPPAEVLLNLLGVPAIQQTMERVAYGEPLTTGRGMTTRVRPEVAEAAMTLLPAAAGTARVAERGAMAAGRAGERMAERVVPQIMERGGMPAGLLEGMSSRTVSPLTVYHGSPAKFERFDPTKIGSGEGAQAYGYGHYVAESPKVADEYRMMLSTHKVTGEAAQDLANYSLRMKPTIEEAINYLQKEKKTAINQSKASSNEFATDEYVKQYDDAIALLRSNKGEKAGNLYTIDLPDEQIARMLDWDKPLSEQPDIVKSINPQSLGLTYKKLENGNHAFVNSEGKIIGNLQRGGTQESFTKNWTEDVLRGTGSDLYRQLGQGMEGGPKVSSALRQAGIPGIRYLDQGSRGAGEGTSNFVVFPGGEDLLTILKRNGGLLGPYPQEQALRLAQKNAAKPISEGGLGLPPDNTPMDRARAMGFESGWAHGSPRSDITELRSSRIGAQGPGAYATNYLPEASTYSQTGEGATVYPLMVRRSEALDTKFNNPYDELGVNADDALLSELFGRGKSAIVTTQEKTPDWLLRAGAPDMPERQHFVSVRPENFRSRFAAFDPARMREADILAGVLPLSLLADEEQRKKADAYFRSLLGQ